MLSPMVQTVSVRGQMSAGRLRAIARQAIANAMLVAVEDAVVGKVERAVEHECHHHGEHAGNKEPCGFGSCETAFVAWRLRFAHAAPGPLWSCLIFAQKNISRLPGICLAPLAAGGAFCGPGG